MPTPVQTSRVQVTLQGVVAGQVLTQSILAPAYQTVGWLIQRSGWLAQDATLAHAVPHSQGQPVPLTQALQHGQVLVLLQPAAHKKRLTSTA